MTVKCKFGARFKFHKFPSYENSSGVFYSIQIHIHPIRTAFCQLRETLIACRFIHVKHVTTHAKVILQGMVEGGRRRESWEFKILEWTRCIISTLESIAEGRE